MPTPDDLFWHEPVRISFKQQEFLPKGRALASGFHINLVAGTVATVRLRLTPSDGSDRTKTRTLYDYFAGNSWVDEDAAISAYTGDTTFWTPPTLPNGNWYRSQQVCIQIPFLKHNSRSLPYNPFGTFLDQRAQIGVNSDASTDVIYPPTNVIVGNKEYAKNVIYMLWQIKRTLEQPVFPFELEPRNGITGSRIIIPLGAGIIPNIQSVHVTLTTIGPSVGTLVGQPEVYKAGQCAFGYL